MYTITAAPFSRNLQDLPLCSVALTFQPSVTLIPACVFMTPTCLLFVWFYLLNRYLLLHWLIGLSDLILDLKKTKNLWVQNCFKHQKISWNVCLLEGKPLKIVGKKESLIITLSISIMLPWQIHAVKDILNILHDPYRHFIDPTYKQTYLFH